MINISNYVKYLFFKRKYSVECSYKRYRKLQKNLVLDETPESLAIQYQKMDKKYKQICSYENFKSIPSDRHKYVRAIYIQFQKSGDRLSVQELIDSRHSIMQRRDTAESGSFLLSDPEKS